MSTTEQEKQDAIARLATAIIFSDATERRKEKILQDDQLMNELSTLMIISALEKLGL